MRRRWMKAGLAAGLCLAAAPALGAAEGGGHTPPLTHRMMLLMLQLGTILIAARLGNVLFEKLRLPGVLGELASGVLIGPYALGGLPAPGLREGLFPRLAGQAAASVPVSPELYGVASLAAVVLLFIVGLETDIRLFLRYSVAGSLVGAGGVLTSFLAGDLMGLAFLRLVLGRPASMLSPPCVFLGIITTATSVGITARILNEKHKTETPEGVTILAGAVVDDVLGIILLAVGLGMLSSAAAGGGLHWGRIGLTAAKAVGIWLAATLIGLLASRRISAVLKGFRQRSAIATLALGLALVLAGLFEEAGLAMIIGAYVAGLSLSRTDISRVILERLGPVHALLVPVFFAVMGMLVDLRALASGRVVAFGLLYAVAGAAAKIVGCGLPALFCGFNLRGALRVGCGMLPRGEVTLIIAGTGLAAGALTPELLGVVVLMLLVTAVLAPPLLVLQFRGTEPGVKKAPAGDGNTRVSLNFPSWRTADLLVGKLVTVFESEGCYVHNLAHGEGLYQMRKDDVVITFRHQAESLVFDCAPDQVAFVRTAVLEVLAELEQTIRELRKPVDVAGIEEQMDAHRPANAPRTTLSQFLASDLMLPRLRGATKAEVIDELLSLLARRGLVADVEAARRAVWRREESMSTGMQHGIAIPHGRTDAVPRLVCAVGLKPEGLDFEALDGGPSRIVVLTLSPESAAAPHVQFMSSVSSALDDAGRTLLLACRTPAEMLQVLTGSRRGDGGAPQPWKGRIFRMRKTRRGGGLAVYLRPELLVTDLKGPDKADVIDELLQVLVRAGELEDRETARRAVLEREARMPTGLGRGVAIPHARTAAVSRLVCAVGLCRDGVTFGGMESAPCRIVVLSLCPPDTPEPLLRLMTMLTRRLDDAGRERALACRTARELYRVLVADQP